MENIRASHRFTFVHYDSCDILVARWRKSDSGGEENTSKPSHSSKSNWSSGCIEWSYRIWPEVNNTDALTRHGMAHIHTHTHSHTHKRNNISIVLTFFRFQFSSVESSLEIWKWQIKSKKRAIKGDCEQNELTANDWLVFRALRKIVCNTFEMVIFATHSPHRPRTMLSVLECICTLNNNKRNNNRPVSECAHKNWI